jgi:hypothetical protein
VEDVIVQEMPDELLVYDRQSHRAHALDRVSAYVWRQCDGQTPVDEIAARLPAELDVPANEDLVRLALDSLRKANLLMDQAEPEPRCSRRELAQRLGKLAIAVPVVLSILAPTAAQASSGSRRRGDNGVGNGEDGQPPGNPPINDGDGTGPGNPGNQGGGNGN